MTPNPQNLTISGTSYGPESSAMLFNRDRVVLMALDREKNDTINWNSWGIHFDWQMYGGLKPDWILTQLIRAKILAKKKYFAIQFIVGLDLIILEDMERRTVLARHLLAGVDHCKSCAKSDDVRDEIQKSKEALERLLELYMALPSPLPILAQEIRDGKTEESSLDLAARYRAYLASLIEK